MRKWRDVVRLQLPIPVKIILFNLNSRNSLLGYYWQSFFFALECSLVLNLHRKCNVLTCCVLFQNQPVEGEEQADMRFRHITEITILTVQLIVEFAKRLPGFDKLLREDQIALLKVRYTQVFTCLMENERAYWCMSSNAVL